jgi:hypothetical protein
VWAALSVVAMSIGVGWLALFYAEMVQETLRAVRVRLTRARRRASIEHLRLERAALHDLVHTLGEGLALPGVVDTHGRVVDGPDSTW